MLTLIFFVYIVSGGDAQNRCTTSFRVPKYHLIESCRRSTLGIVARAKFLSLTKCKTLGVEKNALALNFSPNWNGSETEYPCEALKCAEVDGGLSLCNDTRYDYYSIFAKPMPNINATCVPGIGMFYLFTQKRNYTNAEIDCRDVSSILANVNSEQKTDSLAQLLTGAGVTSAFIGLRKKNGTKFIGTDGNVIDCTVYRAWAPNHPRKNYNHNCVLLTKQHTWRTTPCINKYASLCELMPNGPYTRGSIFKQSIINV